MPFSLLREDVAYIRLSKNHLQYKLQNLCNLQYIGETKRLLKDRFRSTDVQSTKLTLKLNPLLFLKTFFLTLTILILTCS